MKNTLFLALFLFLGVILTGQAYARVKCDDYKAALGKGDVETAKKIITERKKKINQYCSGKDLKESTLLIRAIYSDKAEVVKAAIDAGADVNIGKKDKARTSPLYLAVTDRKPEITRLLIDAGADVKKTTDGWTLVQVAVSYSKVEQLKMLIDAGADVNKVFKKRWPALTNAAKYGKVEAVKLLLDAGADVNYRIKSHFYDDDKYINFGSRPDTPLNVAINPNIPVQGTAEAKEERVKKQLEIAKLLMAKGGKLGTPIKNNRWQVTHGYGRLLEIAAPEGWKPDPDFREGGLAGFLVIFQEKRIEDLKAMLRLGFDPGRLSFLMNATEESPDAMRVLLDHGVPVDSKDDDGRPALLIASYSGRLEVVKLLVEKGADVNLKGPDGRTPLMGAAASGNMEIFNFLLEKGADKDAKANDGVTVLSEVSRGAISGGTKVKVRADGTTFTNTVTNSKTNMDTLKHFISRLSTPGVVPERAKTHFQRGMAAMEMAADGNGDYKEATKEFEKAAGIAPDWPATYFNLGVVYEKAREYRPAASSFQIYLMLKPDANNAKKVENRITRLNYKTEKKK